MILEIKRNIFNKNNCIGNIYADGKRIAFTLEDTPRAEGIKVPAETAIPEGCYLFKVTFSPRFKREMILIFNQKDFTVNQKGISFSGVRIHGGNDEDDTEGCPLIAYNLTDDKLKIYGSAEKELLQLVKKNGGEGILIIKNEPI